MHEEKPVPITLNDLTVIDAAIKGYLAFLRGTVKPSQERATKIELLQNIRQRLKPVLSQQLEGTLKHPPPPTHRNHLPRNPAPLFRSKKNDHISHILWPSHPPQRRLHYNLLLQLGSNPPRLYRSRRHDIRRNTISPQFNCRRARIGLRGILARSI